MPGPTSRDPVKAMNRVLGCLTIASPKLEPAPGQKFTTPDGMPASSRTSINFAALVGESLEGFRITVLAETAGAVPCLAMVAMLARNLRLAPPRPEKKGLREPSECAGLLPCYFDDDI